MANLGTSVGLQGQYQGDSAQNNPAYIKPKENKSGDMIIDFLDKEERKKQEEQEIFNKQISPFISIDGSKYLPERVPLVKEQAQKVLQQAMRVKGQRGNVMFDENVNKEIAKLNELQNKYSKEALIANEFQKKMLTDQAFEYDDNIKESVSKAIEGRAGLDDNKYISSEFIDKGRNYSKYRKPEDRAKFLAYYTPNANEEIVTRVMENGVYKDKVIKGSQIYETPEGVAAQKEKFYNLAKTSQNPYVKGWIRQAEEEINANDDLVFQENFKDLTPLEAQDFIAQRAADLMLQDAVNTNKLKKVDKTTKVGTGFQFNNNFQATAGGGAKGKVYNVEPAPIQPMYPAGKDGKPQMDKAPLVKNPKYFSIQSVAQGENAPKVVLGRYKGAVVEGVVRDEDTGKVKFAYIAIPEKKTQGFVLKGDEARSAFVPIDDADINNIRTNIGADQYDASIGKWEKPQKAKEETPKKEQPKQTNYSIPQGGVPKYNKDGKLIGYELNGEKFKF